MVEKSSFSILLIDDEDLFREDMSALLNQHGYPCTTAENGEQGLKLANANKPELILCDIALPDTSGLDLLDGFSRDCPESHVIMITAFGNIDSALEAFRKGAVDYVLKPVAIEDLLNKVNHLKKYIATIQENRLLRQIIQKGHKDLVFIGGSKKTELVRQRIERVAPTQCTVLITGESGTGKEIVAKEIHTHSLRRSSQFVAVNCAGIPDNLVESELFGHVKGAFTGATENRIGHLEAAGEGSLFLDEIGDMPVAAQSKLLRVLENKEFTPVGSSKPKPLRARIIAATNQNLQQTISEGRFREDLYFRLAVMDIPIAPLRERTDDLLPLLQHFVSHFNQEMNKHVSGFDSDALQLITRYSWPGNVRQLKNVIERALILTQSSTIRPEDLPEEIVCFRESSKSNSLKKSVREHERTEIISIIEQCSGNKEEAARRLEINPSTLYRKMTDLDI